MQSSCREKFNKMFKYISLLNKTFNNNKFI